MSGGVCLVGCGVATGFAAEIRSPILFKEES